MLIFEHEHCKLVKELIVDCIQNITTALTAVSTAEYVIDEAKLIFEFKINSVFLGDRLLYGTELGLCNLNAEFIVLDKVERHDVAVTDTTENFGAFDLVIKIILYNFDFRKIAENPLFKREIGRF